MFIIDIKMTQTNQQQYTCMKTVEDGNVKEYPHLYDVHNQPKILPEKYAVCQATLFDTELYYNHTPKHCLSIVAEARLAW